MKDFVKRLKEKLDKMTPEELAAEYESITHEKFNNRWCEKFHNLSTDQRSEIIKKTIKKYRSKEYVNRELKLGYEPREVLYFMFAHYAEKYGEVLPDEYFTDFVAEAMIFDDTWIVQVLIGQGTVVHITHKEDYDRN